jgi:hypothetical protein
MLHRVIDRERVGQAPGIEDALNLAARPGQSQAAVAGPDTVPDSGEDADDGRIDEDHAGRVHHRAVTVPHRGRPGGGGCWQAGGRHVNFTGHPSHGDACVEMAVQGSRPGSLSVLIALTSEGGALRIPATAAS